MKATIRFTYSTTTPESAAEGDYADHGYYLQHRRFSMVEDREAIIEQTEQGGFNLIDLGQALRDARSLGIVANTETCGSFERWWESIDPDIDYATGESTTYALHIDGITDSTRRRINRWLARH